MRVTKPAVPGREKQKGAALTAGIAVDISVLLFDAPSAAVAYFSSRLRAARTPRQSPSATIAPP